MSNEQVTVVSGDERFGVSSKIFWVDDLVVPDDFPEDVRNLGVGRVRLERRWDAAGPYSDIPDCRTGPGRLEQGLQKVLEAVQKYKSKGLEPLLVLGGGLLSVVFDEDPQKDFSPNGTGTCPPLPEVGNQYITAFAARAGHVARYFSSVVKCYQIWNEPNFGTYSVESPESIDSATNFGTLVAAASRAIRDAAAGDVTIVTGGVHFETDTISETSYLTTAMSRLQQLQNAQPSGPGEPRPILFWDRTGVNMYTDIRTLNQPRELGFLSTLSVALRPQTLPRVAEFQASMWVTEFGSRRPFIQAPTLPGTNNVSDPSSDRAQQAALLNWFRNVICPALRPNLVDAAFWFSHVMYQHPAEVAAGSHAYWGLTNWIQQQGTLGQNGGTILPEYHWGAWVQFAFELSSPNECRR